MLPPLYRRWTAKDLQALLEAKVRENRFLEYKRDLPSTKEAVKDLLADVSAFANASGGTILYGIEEDQGEPIACPGIGCLDAQETIERFSNIIGSSLDPPLRGFTPDVIEAEEGKHVLVLQISQSPSAPHMLNKGSPKFYSRGVAGNVPTGSEEIRAAFLAAEGMAEKVRAFVEQRSRLIQAREIDFVLSTRGEAVLHIIPIEAFSRPRTVSMTDLETVKKEFVPAVIGSAFGHRYCLEGMVAVSWLSEQILSYSLLFRNGCVEATCPCRHESHFLEGKIAEKFAQVAPKYEDILRSLGFTSPFFVSLTILGCKGAVVYVDEWRSVGQDIRPLKTDFLTLPISEWVEDPVDWRKILRNFCDLSSNAMGLPFSFSFKSDGSLA
jgi:schlafen family protein